MKLNHISNLLDQTILYVVKNITIVLSFIVPDLMISYPKYLKKNHFSCIEKLEDCVQN